jgi:hypothetical protein
MLEAKTNLSPDPNLARLSIIFRNILAINKNILARKSEINPNNIPTDPKSITNGTNRVAIAEKKKLNKFIYPN